MPNGAPVATRYHIGAKQLESNVSSYAKRFDFLEVRMPSFAERGPSLALLRRWRKQVPPHFDFSVVVGPTASHLRPGREHDEEIDAALAAADALQARCMLVVTPVEVSPAAVWRDRLAKFAARVHRDATHLAWEPRGPWETEDARRLARGLELVLSVDPARDPVPPGSVAYCRLRALGETRSFGAAALERVVANIGTRRDAYVVIETSSALAECKRLRQIVQRPARREGGFGRVVRPRATIMKVKDDEQE